jgi:hypothetical protein
MKDHDQPINPRDLSSRLAAVKKSHSFPSNGDSMSRGRRMSRVGTTSSTTSSRDSITFSRLPVFSKSSTMSTTASDDSDLRIERAWGTGEPTADVQRHSAEVGQGQFSKPRAGERRRRERRESNESAKTVPEFKYYGRHANDWLFNGFSISDSVKKGWGKVFSGKNDD